MRNREPYESVIETIGWTPLIRLTRVTRGIRTPVYAKAEIYNPGGSVKDRIGGPIIEAAERDGSLKPGGTLVEGTSGNTGIGLAIAAALKGYRCIFTMPDKMSQEKVRLLKAFGAEVIITPTAVPPDHPDNYVMMAKRIAEETPNAVLANQFYNPANPQAHYETTGPELWEQTAGRITHFVAAAGTGGTITGVGRYLKERNPKVKVWGIDTYGSVFKKYKETGVFDKNEIYPYITEGIGEDFLPANVDFSVIDHFEKVTDKDAAIMTRRITREEGIFAGNSAGSAMAGLLQLREHFTKDDVIVVILHDHGSRYLAKMYNDEWMRSKGFLEVSGMTARDLVALGVSGELFAVEAARPVEEAIRVMSDHDFSQISVTRNGRVVGSLNESHLYNEFLSNREVKNKPVEAIMQPAFPFVDISTPVQLLSTMISPENPAVLVRDFKTEKTFIITRSDIIRVLM
jgi:cystathionine beta-synthase